MMELLTEQQKLILKKRAEGISNADIARELEVSPAYVSKTFKNIREKITTVDTTVSLLKEIGYMDETISLQITDKTLDKLKSLPTPKLKTKPSQSKKKHTIQNRYRMFLQQSFDYVRNESPEGLYSHQIPKFQPNENQLAELLVTVQA